MTAEIISGTEMRKAILAELKGEVAEIVGKYGKPPGLVPILVGKSPASVSYVKNKIATALGLGFHEVQEDQPDTITEADLNYEGSLTIDKDLLDAVDLRPYERVMV